MNEEQETLDLMALTRLSYFHLAPMLQLYRALGSATEIVRHRGRLRQIVPETSERMEQLLQKYDEVVVRCEEEWRWMEQHQVRALRLDTPAYPARLAQCADPPLVLFSRGTAELNTSHIINIVGTRRITPYGRDLIASFVSQLSQLLPDAVIVSGLAYGVDVAAHREALANGLSTVAVLAHGLDTIYPSHHRETANAMLERGGLVTEFMTHTPADKIHFVRRNRITAGLCDATILVESAAKGGGLITAGIANDYGRDVFAFPGAVGATYSEGCNHLIRDNKAVLITSAHDLVQAMGWERDAQIQKARKVGIARELFPELSPEEQRIVQTLKKHNDLQLNILCVQSGLPIHRLTALLFDLEIKGVVRALAGGTYHLLG